MVYISSSERKCEICRRVKEVRIKNFGEGWGHQKQMADAMGIPYTTYRGYEGYGKDCRTNYEFLKRYAERWAVDLDWLLVNEESKEEKKEDKYSVYINPENNEIRSKRYKVFTMEDDSMEPVIPRGSKFGIEKLDAKDIKTIHGRIIAYSGRKITLRKATVQGSAIIGVPLNPDPLYKPFIIHKKEIFGIVAWVFKKL